MAAAGMRSFALSLLVLTCQLLALQDTDFMPPFSRSVPHSDSHSGDDSLSLHGREAVLEVTSFLQADLVFVVCLQEWVVSYWISGILLVL